MIGCRLSVFNWHRPLSVFHWLGLADERFEAPSPAVLRPTHVVSRRMGGVRTEPSAPARARAPPSKGRSGLGLRWDRAGGGRIAGPDDSPAGDRQDPSRGAGDSPTPA